MGRRGKRLLALLFLLCNAFQLLIGKAHATASNDGDGGPRGGPPQSIKRSFDTSAADSWSFFNIGSSRNKRKLPSGKETISDFTCRDRPPGYYADIKLGCEVYHLCNRHGGGMAFECPRGTRFQQRTMVCDHQHLVECHNSAKYFHSNLRIGQANLNFIDDKTQTRSENDNDVFMQVVVREQPTTTQKPASIRDNQRMQLVLKNKAAKKEDTFNSNINSNTITKSLPKGRGKDSFFLSFGVAQDFDSPASGHIRDQRKVLPNVLLNQLQESGSKPVIKPLKKPKKSLPSFPNYPVTMNPDSPDSTLTFHQAFGTDFDSAVKATTVKKPLKKRPNFILTPPELNAPIANFYGSGSRKQNLPHNHPLRQILPASARVVGIQPLRKIPLSNRGGSKNTEIMTLTDFLKKYPTMEKMKTAAIVPVPVTDEKHIRMIELLAAKQKAKQKFNDEEMFAELEQLISKRAERKISFLHRQNLQHLQDDKPAKPAELAVRPRGGLPGPRFMTTTSSSSPDQSSPKLEFGFVPIVDKSQTKSTLPAALPIFTTPSPRSAGSFHFANFDAETDQLAAPRLPRQPSIIEDSFIGSNEISDDNDAFFFTTTPKPYQGSVTSPSSLEIQDKIKPGIFDMRKFFFIPTKNHKQPKIQAERRVTTHHNLPPGYPPHPHRGFFRG